MADQVLRIVEYTLDSTKNRATVTAPQKPVKLTDNEYKKLQGRLAAIRALMTSWWGDIPVIIQHGHQALKYLPQNDPWCGLAAIALGDTYDAKGDLGTAHQALDYKQLKRAVQ